MGPLEGGASGGVNQYHIQLAGPRGAALPSGAWLHAAEGRDGDRRDDESSYLCVHDSERSVWQLNPCLPWQSALPDNQHGSHSPLQGQLPFPQNSDAELKQAVLIPQKMSDAEVRGMWESGHCAC